MPKIIWDEVGQHLYETGVDHGVLFPIEGTTYGKGVAWNGLTSIKQSPSGAEGSAKYADNIKYLNIVSAEDFSGTIEAFMYPDEFIPCDGAIEAMKGVVLGQQSRKMFGLCYRTKIGNDTEGVTHGYKIHMVYGCQASPSERSYSTINESPEPTTMSWSFKTTPVAVEGYSPVAHMELDSTKVSAAQMEALEKILYGDDSTDARLPLPSEILNLLKTGA